LAAGVAGLLLVAWIASRAPRSRELPRPEAPQGEARGDGASESRAARRASPDSAPAGAAGGAAPAEPAPESATAAPPSSAEPPGVGRLATSLEGALLWDASVGARDFRVTCRRAGDPAELNVYLGSDGRFRRFAMEPGRVDVLVRMAGEETPVLTIPGVAIPAGAPADDPRLRAIDVRSVRRIALAFADADGNPITGTLHALVLRPDGETGRHFRIGGRHDGRLRVLISDADARASVWADGYAPRTVELRGDPTVVLPARTLVRVRVKGPTLRVHLVPSGWEGAVVGNPTAFDATDAEEREPEEMRAADIPVVTLLEWHRDQASASHVWTFAVTKTGDYEAYCTRRTRGGEGGEDDEKLASRVVAVRDLAEDQDIDLVVPRK
jgi:hypothetical protein